MHSSLKLQANLIVILTCALVASTISIMTHPFPAIPLLAGALFGVAAGIMQSRSVTLAPDVLRSAQTATDVRRALTSTAPGKRAIQIQWALLPILLASAFWVGNPLGQLAGLPLSCAFATLLRSRRWSDSAGRRVRLSSQTMS